MTVEWLYNRLRTMSRAEIAHRLREAYRERLQALGVGNAKPDSPTGARGSAWLGALPERIAPDPYCKAADEILDGYLHVFSLRPCRTGFPPDWNRDPKTGTRAPLAFGRGINYRNETLVGNIKYLWEPNRHLELVTLAQAWHLTRRERYAMGCRDVLESWIQQCPYPLGPNWSSSLELGIRLVNWSFAWHLLGGEASSLFARTDGARFKQRWLTAIYQHCHFIARYPSRHSSANNHLMGELLGLLVGSLTWPKWPDSAGWATAAKAAFHREALAQNSPDGVNREQAIWYQHEVADMMIIAAMVARANGVEFDAEYWQRLHAMLEFVASLMDCAGNVPAFGDSDDAVIVRFCPDADFPVFRSLLATGAVLFERSDFKAKAGEFDAKSRWLLGDGADARFHALAADEAGRLPRPAFPEGGYYVLGADFESPREVRIVVDAGPLGYLSIAAHGHSDALSFTLSAGGREVLIDPGTYAYHTDRDWREYFRGTTAHNVLCVDGQAQSVSGGNFMWSRHAKATCHYLALGDDPQVLSVSHDGYGRLPDPVVHHRVFRYSRAERVLQVCDRIVAGGTHRVDMYLHFSESCDVTLLADHALVTTGGDLSLIVDWPKGMVARLARGEESPPIGWISRRFDRRHPIYTLVVSGETRGTWSGTTELRILLPEDRAHGS